jgi:hypothetical protein
MFPREGTSMSPEPATSIISQAGPLSDSRRKLRALLELGIGYGLILIVIWTPCAWQRPFYLAALSWILLVTLLSFDTCTRAALRPALPGRSTWIIGVALLIAAIAIVFAYRLQTLHPPHGTMPFIKAFWGYGIWSLVQQFLLQCFVLLRLLRILPNQRIAVAAAVGLFAIAHLPNPILTAVTLLWGSAACLLFLRYRNLYTLGLAHAIFGISLAITVPGQVSHNMRVGLGYLRYPSTHHRYRSQSDHTVSTEVCVTAEAPTRYSLRQARP